MSQPTPPPSPSDVLPPATPNLGATTPWPRRWLPDLVAGLSMAGLLLPEAVAYAGIAGLPPAAGLVGLLAGLLAYGLIGRSPQALVAATSSSAAVLGAATLSLAGTDAALRSALAAGLVLLTGLAFTLAAAARLGAVASFISKPVLRGFAFGLALSVAVRQLAHITGVHTTAHDTPSLLWAQLAALPQWHGAGVATGLAALLLLRLLRRWHRLPGTLLVIALGIAASAALDLPAHGVDAVGPITLDHALHPGLPGLARAQWLRLGELAVALLLLLFAESQGAIRAVALRHGDAVWPNRDLAALGAANLLSGLFQGLPVGAGLSATLANEAVGARSRRAGLVAAAVVLALVATVLPWVARTPEPVLAAVVVHALGHALSLDAFRPYFRWRRDRVVVVAAALAVLLLGVLDGLLVGILASLAMTLKDLSRPAISQLGRLAGGHDFLPLTGHAQVRAVPGLLIVRPEAALFFANVDNVLAQLDQLVAAQRPAGVVLSLEETPDLDGTAIEALQAWAMTLAAHDIRLLLARVKDPVAAVLAGANHPALDASALDSGSVDDAVRRLLPWLTPPPTTPPEPLPKPSPKPPPDAPPGPPLR